MHCFIVLEFAKCFCNHYLCHFMPNCLFLFLKDDMMRKKNAYMDGLASQYPEGTPVEDIPISKEAGRDILMDTLGVKLGKEIKGLGFGSFMRLVQVLLGGMLNLLPSCRRWRHSWLRLIAESLNWKLIVVLCGSY